MMLHENGFVLVFAGTDNATHESSGEIPSSLIEKLYACAGHLENSANLRWIRTDVSEGLHTSVLPGIELFCYEFVKVKKKSLD